jgi:hypothetical protein
MRRACTRCPSVLRLTTVSALPFPSISTSVPRYANEGTSPKAKALEVYQVPKSNIPGRTILTQPVQRPLREMPKWLLWMSMKLFRSRAMRKATVANKAKTAMREYYALCATRATADGDESSTGFWYDGTFQLVLSDLIRRTRSPAQLRNVVSNHCPTCIYAAYSTEVLPSANRPDISANAHRCILRRHRDADLLRIQY